MRVVKLNSRHTLYKKYGFNHALRFDGWSSEVAKFEGAAYLKWGNQYDSRTLWKTHWTKPNGRTGGRPYWIGVQNQAMLTQLLLSV
jgi:hypothetical protein